MFSRNTERPPTNDGRPPAAPTTPPGVRDVSVPAPPPAQAQPAAASVPTDLTLIGRADRLEGTLKVADTLRIQGTLEGTVEATTVHIDEGAKVRADITADEVIIGGDYSGKLVCRQRLEIRATGQVVGHVETFRLMLHEGGSIDGELKMLKQPGMTERLRPGRVEPRVARPRPAIECASAELESMSDPACSPRPTASPPPPSPRQVPSPSADPMPRGGCALTRQTHKERPPVSRRAFRIRSASARLRAALGEAVGAVDGLAAGGSEGDLRDLAAAGAGCLEHLAGRTVGVAAAAAGAVATATAGAVATAATGGVAAAGAVAAATG